MKEDAANFKEFGYLQATHYNSWKGKDVQPILSGKPDFKSTGMHHKYWGHLRITYTILVL